MCITDYILCTLILIWLLLFSWKLQNIPYLHINCNIYNVEDYSKYMEVGLNLYKISTCYLRITFTLQAGVV
jgi:hypothetical protein